jgi:5'-deoxynucleotidase YfbR-like HD superfamily hydrolase
MIQDKQDRFVIVLSDGRPFSLSDPRPEDVRIETIAHSLAQQCRWTGQTRAFYSIAQHCIDVSFIVEPEYALAGLLHDASEAYIGDVSSPLKWLLETRAPGVLKTIEGMIHLAIASRFDTPYPFPPEVKHADMVAAATERRDLLTDWDQHGIDWIDGWPEPIPRTFNPISPELAEKAYVKRFKDLTA